MQLIEQPEIPPGLVLALLPVLAVQVDQDVLCGWLPRCKDFLTALRPSQVQSCVRPVDAVLLNRWP